MIVGVEEARSRWCPMVRLKGRKDFYPHNRNEAGMLIAESMCVGEQCMMWRWTARTGTVEKTTVSSGYCGLAGKPVQD